APDARGRMRHVCALSSARAAACDPAWVRCRDRFRECSRLGCRAAVSWSNRPPRAARAAPGRSGVVPATVRCAFDAECRLAIAGRARELAVAQRMDTTHGWESTPLANARWLAFTRTAWWPRVWPPLFLTVLVVLALGQFLQVGLVSTDWWPV